MALLVRVAFTLGNLTASNERNRRLLGLELGGARKLAQVLDLVHARWAANQGSTLSPRGEGKEDDGGTDYEEVTTTEPPE